jgi:hypothetical protein
MRTLPKNGSRPATLAGRKLETVQSKRTNGPMNRGATKGTRPRGCWRQWLATALLLLAFAALGLQAGAHSLPAAHMTHAEPAVAVALDQNCDHSHAAAGWVQPISGDSDAFRGDGPASLDDCCNQFCMITAVLPEGVRADPPSGGEGYLGIMADRPGRTPEGILRPPRSSIVV